jgi:hypothetical protein
VVGNKSPDPTQSSFLKQEAVRCYEAASELTESKKELQLLFQKMSKLIQ